MPTQLIMPLQKTLTLIPILLLLPTLLPLTASQISKPSCIDHCGSVSIPFPFGTTSDCYHSQSFWVTCNHTVEKLFWENTNIEIKNISLYGQLTIMTSISSNCLLPNGSIARHNRHQLTSIPLFPVNNTANKFTIIGCDSYGFVYGRKSTGRRYSTGCMASCSSKEDFEEEEGSSCMGTGCCQISIPKDVRTVRVQVSNFKNYSEVKGFSNCTYGFFVQESAFTFHPDNLTNLKDVDELPMVVDWTIDNRNCDDAPKNQSAYACKSDNSLCDRPDNGDGYRCRCKHGYDGNPYLIGGCEDIDECKNKPCGPYECVNKPGGYDCLCPKGYHGMGRPISLEGDCMPNESHKMTLIAGITLGAIILLLIGCLAYLERNRRNSRKVKRKCFRQNGGDSLLDRVKIFSFSELKKATKDFHKDNIVGQGGFGTVYRGVLSNDQIVAIKKSNRVDVNQINQFVQEVILLSQMNHRNIVKLLGCCLETEVPHLVYEFINNGSLYMHLHDPRHASLLNWENRLRIAAEVAGVLAYLHSAAEDPIIHRDVKSENILLDTTFTAKVADFGASRLIPLDQTQISTVVQGTPGYLDPEYLLTHQLTAKSDVYSFGVVLLEMITGRSAVSFSGPEAERSLVQFSKSVMKQDNFFLLVDGCIARDGKKEEIMKVAGIAKWCVEMKGEDRPDMKVVAMELENLMRVGMRKQSNIRERERESPLQVEALGLHRFIENGKDSSSSLSGCYSSYVDEAARPMSGGR